MITLLHNMSPDHETIRIESQAIKIEFLTMLITRPFFSSFKNVDSEGQF